MMFTIRGADSATGREVILTIEAPNPDEATGRANAKGIYVASVEPELRAAALRHRTTTAAQAAVSPPWPPGFSRRRILIAVVAVLFLILAVAGWQSSKDKWFPVDRSRADIAVNLSDLPSGGRGTTRYGGLPADSGSSPAFISPPPPLPSSLPPPSSPTYRSAQVGIPSDTEVEPPGLGRAGYSREHCLVCRQVRSRYARSVHSDPKGFGFCDDCGTGYRAWVQVLRSAQGGYMPMAADQANAERFNQTLSQAFRRDDHPGRRGIGLLIVTGMFASHEWNVLTGGE